MPAREHAGCKHASDQQLCAASISTFPAAQLLDKRVQSSIGCELQAHRWLFEKRALQPHVLNWDHLSPGSRKPLDVQCQDMSIIRNARTSMTTAPGFTHIRKDLQGIVLHCYPTALVYRKLDRFTVVCGEAETLPGFR